MSDRPSLLFVFADQMRGMDMGCAGNEQVRTPVMDQLAAEGVFLPNTFANCAVCTPSRGTILTGRYPHAHRAVANDLPLPVAERSIGTLLQEQGYATGYIGKWHLDGVPRDRFTPPGPRRHGFRFWAAWNCAHDYFHGRIYRDTPEPILLEGYEPVGQTDLAIQFLQDHREVPFALFLSWGPPHAPYDQVPENYRQLYAPESIALRPNVRREPPPGFHSLVSQPDPRRTLADYYAHITALDEQLGRLLDTLDALRLRERTIVVFTSDHGDMLWSQGMTKKEQPWEESIRIPFLLRWPGEVPSGKRPETLFSTVDFVPTLLELMELPIPETVQGSNLAAAFRGGEAAGPESVFLTAPVIVDQGLAQGIREWRGVRTARYTYARWWDGEGWLLYDNQVDPFQLKNRIHDPEWSSVRAEMERLLEQWLRRTEDPCLSWDETIRSLGLVELWNARERALRGSRARLL